MERAPLRSADVSCPALAPVDFAPLQTARLQLRSTVEEDVDPLHDILSRAEVTRYLLHPPLTREEVMARILRTLGRLRLREDGDLVRVSALRREDGVFVAELILRVTSAAGLAVEVGWTVHPDHRGRGYATEAAIGLLDFAFGPLGAHRAEAHLYPGNLASIAVCTRLGMRAEALHRLDLWVKGAWEDTAVYAILDQEWAARG